MYVHNTRTSDGSEEDEVIFIWRGKEKLHEENGGI